MPINPVTKDNQVEIVDHEINDPPVVHRDLFAKRDSGSSKNIAHRDLDVRPLRLGCVVIDSGAITRAKVMRTTKPRRYSTRGFLERFFACIANTIYPIFSPRTPISSHCYPVVLTGALAGAESLSLRFSGVPSRTKLVAASFASNGGSLWNVRVFAQSSILACPAAKLCSAFDVARECLVLLPAEVAGYKTGFHSVDCTTSVDAIHFVTEDSKEISV